MRFDTKMCGCFLGVCLFLCMSSDNNANIMIGHFDILVATRERGGQVSEQNDNKLDMQKAPGTEATHLSGGCEVSAVNLVLRDIVSSFCSVHTLTRLTPCCRTFRNALRNVPLRRSSLEPTLACQCENLCLAVVLRSLAHQQAHRPFRLRWTRDPTLDPLDEEFSFYSDADWGCSLWILEQQVDPFCGVRLNLNRACQDSHYLVIGFFENASPDAVLDCILGVTDDRRYVSVELLITTFTRPRIQWYMSGRVTNAHSYIPIDFRVEAT